MSCTVKAATIFAGMCLAAAQAEETLRPETEAMLKTALASISRIKDLQGSVSIRNSSELNRDAAKARITALETLEARGLDPTTSESVRERIDELRSQLREAKPVETVEAPVEWRIHRDGSYRAAWLAEDGTILGVHAHDGSKAIEYSSLMRRGFILEKPKEPSPGLRLPFVIYPGYGVLETFEQARRSGSITHAAGEGDLLGTVRFAARVPGRPERTLRVWFDPDRGFSIRRQELGMSQGKEFVLEIAFVPIEVRQIAGDIWFPLGGRVEAYEQANVADPKKPPEEWPLQSFGSTSHYTFAFKNLVVNAGLEPQHFQFEFPVGTRVNDMRTGTIRTVESRP